MKKKIATLVLVLVVGALLGVVMVSAQQPQPAQGQMQPRPPHPPMDPLGDVMFPPEMIMGHTRELNLTDEQKTFMRTEINRATTRFNELQWQVQDEMEALHALMKENSVNEQLALAQLDKVLNAEREMAEMSLYEYLIINRRNHLPDAAEQLKAIRLAEHSRVAPRGLKLDVPNYIVHPHRFFLDVGVRRAIYAYGLGAWRAECRE